MKKIRYNGTSKILLRLCSIVNALIDDDKQSDWSQNDTDSIDYIKNKPTKLSDFNNDTGFITKTVNNLTNYYKKSETYTQAEVDSLISAIVTLDIQVVQALPTQDISTTTIYLVPKATAETQDIYDEYIYVNSAWEHIGSTQVDLSNYYNKTEVDDLLDDKVDKITGKGLSTNDFTNTLKTKLNGIETGAEVNVQANWSEIDTTSDAYIQNKPTIPTVNDGTVTFMQGNTNLGSFSANQSSNATITIPAPSIDINNEAPTFTESSTRANIASGETIATLFGKIKKFFTDLASVAFSGSYNDLSDKPTIPTVNNATLTIQKNGTTVKTFTANASSNVTANITVPTNNNELTNGAGYITSSGSCAYATSAGSANSVAWSNVSDKPTIPTVNNATLTIQKNGTTVKTFTANASSNVTANITVPTKTSDITNDSNYVSDASYVHTDNNFTSTLKTKLDGIASGAEVNQNAFSNVTVGNTTIAADGKTDTLTLVAGDNVTLTPDATNDKITIASDNTTYTASNGVSLSGTNFTNSGVRSIATGSTKGTISVNTNGTSANVAVKGLGSAAYTASSAYAVNTTLTNQDLNSLTSPGFYNAGGGNTVTNKPSGVDHFGLEVIHNASGSYYTQIIYDGAATNVSYRRTCTNGTWSNWVQDSPILTLGETSSTAYRGDRGKTAYNHAVDSNKLTTATNSGLYKVASTSNGHIASLTAVTKSDITGLGIPAQDTTYSVATTSANGLMSSSDKTKLNGIASGAEVNVQADWSETTTSSDAYIKNKPTLATVATSGAYSDLTGTPTIPTVNNATLTIQKNGTNVQTFTANASSNKTANITVPTKVSELTADVGKAVYYGTCATAAATAAKVVTVSAGQNFALEVGATVGVKFTYTNSYSATSSSGVTLNVNSTGAKKIYWANTSAPTGTNTTPFGRANYINYYMYDGTYWVWAGSSGDNNTTYSTMSASELTTGTATSARTVRADYLKTGIDTLIDNKIGAITFVLKNQTLTFSNLVATVSDARVTADTYAMVFFNDATLQVAADAGVVVDTSSGTITFTATSAPSSTLVCDIVCRKG